ncbi:MAG TPA: DUF6298 domain-containing protein [Paludibacter sp.]|nr:DUF6298 domain-containing protein [Paludibacter sp.]
MNSGILKFRLSFVILLFFQQVFAQQFPLLIKDNKITYLSDSLGNTILDFSFCGYRNSENEIPDLTNAIFVPHTEGNMSESIQRAIDYVSALKPDTKGFRGAVLLDKGVFELDRSIYIRTSGVILRGTDKKETILLKKGVERGALLYIEGKNDFKIIDTFEIKSNYVAVNSTTFEISTPAKIKMGDRIKIIRPSTKEWIKSIGCDIFGGGISALGWKPGDTDIAWDRTVKEISENKITIDAPLTVALDARFGGAKINTYEWSSRISESGVENLTLVSDYDKKYPKDEDHCWTGISIENAENCWVRRINFNHFAGNAVILQPSTSKVSIEDCISKEPVSEIGGFRRISFYNMGQLNLFQRCYSENGINDFAVGFSAPGPNAFVQCEAKNALGFSGSIDAWACGLLFDIVNIDGNNLSFKNLGQSKNGAGWNTANSLFWQCTAAEIECYSPSADAKNRAYGCWAQFSGDGDWGESNNHVHPRSLFYGQLSERLQRDMSANSRLLLMGTEASSSPTVDAARAMVVETKKPLLTLEKWIEQAEFKPSVDNTGIKTVSDLKTKPLRIRAYVPDISVINGRIVCDGALITGGITDVSWWSGKTKFSFLKNAKPHITRFVPGREGWGLTDKIDSVVTFMKNNNIAVLDHNYGLWYDRRRDDHQRIRRRDGDVWAPFYEQPFARSGIETAWDGLSKYDLMRPNKWYWSRLKEFATKAQNKGLLLFNEHFFQHNIIEAGAHWVDCPWRSANNINDLGFPEPVNFAGDKRVFMADVFYDLSNQNRRNIYRNYIRQSLDNFAANKNTVHLISAEYTGTLDFVQFWLDVIDEWQIEKSENALVALSCTKDVQDAILADKKRASVVDIIDIRYWHYKNDGTVYAPLGGQNLAPRQHARLMKVGKVTFHEAYKAVNEYRTQYPDKAVTYYAQNYPEMNWAVFMAGGSLPLLPVKNREFLSAAAQMKPQLVKSGTYKMLVKSGTGTIIYAEKLTDIQLELEKGKFSITFFDSKTGEEKLISKSIQGNRLYTLKTLNNASGVWWFKKL